MSKYSKLFLILLFIALFAISWCFSQLLSSSEEYATKAQKELDRAPAASADRASANALMAIYNQDKEQYQKTISCLETIIEQNKKIIQQNNELITTNQEVVKLLKEKSEPNIKD